VVLPFLREILQRHRHQITAGRKHVAAQLTADPSHLPSSVTALRR
jgi:hypothetical protein